MLELLTLTQISSNQYYLWLNSTFDYERRRTERIKENQVVHCLQYARFYHPQQQIAENLPADFVVNITHSNV